MRSCWLLAVGLVIGAVGLRDAAAEEFTGNVLREAGSAKVDGDDGAGATLSALSKAVKVPPARRHAFKPAPTTTGRPAPIVRLAKPSPYAAPESMSEEESSDGSATRLVSHSETAPEPAKIISEEAPEPNSPIVRPATVWTPTEVGDVEDDTSAPIARPAVSTEKRESSRAVVGGAANPLRQAPTSTVLSRDLTNPLR